MSAGRRARTVPIRRGLVAATTGTTVLAVIVIAVPLAFVRVATINSEADEALRTRATSLALAVHERVQDDEPVDRDTIASRLLPGSRVTVDTLAGRIEAGPQLTGRVRSQTSPVIDGVQVTMTVDDDDTTEDVRVAVLVVVALALTALVAAAIAGRLLARRIAAPIESLAVAAAAAGHGDLGRRTPRSGLREIDEVAEAMDATLDRLAARLDDERRLSDAVAHQLRNSLTALRLQVEVAAMSVGDGPHQATLQRVLAQVDRLDDTIRDLTAVTRDTGSGAREPAADVVAERLEFWRPSFERGGRAVELAAASEPRAVDGGALRQGLDVLVENSLRHGGGTLRVAVEAGREHVVVRVADDGEGIPQDMERRIFDRGVSGGSGGHGLGLAIAKEMLVARGGRLELTSARPARFEIWLPATATAEAGAASGRNASATDQGAR